MDGKYGCRIEIEGGGKSSCDLPWECIKVNDSKSQTVLHELSRSSSLQVKVDGSK